MVNYPAFVIWKKVDDKIQINEVTEKFHISKSENIVIGNYSTNMYFKVSSQNELKDKIYDLASRYWSDWDVEISYDGYFGHNNNPIEVTIKGLEEIDV